MPGLPVKELTGEALVSSDLKNLYILEYINKRKIDFKVFIAKDVTMKELVPRVKAHCENMGFRFLFCRPFLSSLAEDEKKHLQEY